MYIRQIQFPEFVLETGITRLLLSDAKLTENRSQQVVCCDGPRDLTKMHECGADVDGDKVSGEVGGESQSRVLQSS